MKEQFFSNKLHAFMFCLKIVFMCAKVEASLRHQSVKLLIGASRTCMHNFFLNFLLLRPCIYKTWNFTLVLLLKCCSWKRPLLLTKLIFARLLRLCPVTSSFQLIWHIFCFLFIFLKVIVISHVKYTAVTSSFTIQSHLLVTWSLKNSSRRNDETFRCRNIWWG